MRAVALKRSLLTVFAVLACAVLGANVAGGQTLRTPEGFAATLGDWNAVIEMATRELERGELTDKEISILRQELQRVRDAAVMTRNNVKPHQQAVGRLLQALGQPPPEGAEHEPEVIVKQRQQLNGELTDLTARLKHAELKTVAAEELLQRISEAKRAQVVDELMYRRDSLFSLAVWAGAIDGIAKVSGQVLMAPAEIWRSDFIAGRWRAAALNLAGVLFASVLLSWPLRYGLLRLWGRRPGVPQPSYRRRLFTACVEGVARGLIPSAVAGAIAAAIYIEQGTTGLFAQMVFGAMAALAFFFMGSAFARAIATPDDAAWRLLPVDPAAARGIHRRVVTLSMLIGVHIFVAATAQRVAVPGGLVTVYGFALTGLIGLNIASLFIFGPKRRAELPGTARPVGGLSPAIRIAVAALALASPVSAAIGYVDLAAYLTASLVLTGVVVGTAWALRHLSLELAVLLIERHRRPMAVAGRPGEAGVEPAQGARLWLATGLDMIIGVGALFSLLIVWRVDSEDLMIRLRQWMQEIKVGDYAISPADAFFALLIVVISIAVTRRLQRALDERVFPQTRLDPGLRHSLKAALGYGGLLIGGLLAVATLGLNLTNIALVAGALSVGIGFGLQSIVNNFVSGLILLVERPIKVGDWVVVGDQQGIIKRINVRATELQTFQRASILIPNSQLISGAVTNWTYKDKMARIDIPVGVAYGSDIDKVEEVLLACARDHPQVDVHPPPQALLRQFGESSIDYELRAYISNVDYVLTVQSDLCKAIVHGFRAAGIEIPFPQRDLNIKGDLAAGLERSAPAAVGAETSEPARLPGAAAAR